MSLKLWTLPVAGLALSACTTSPDVGRLAALDRDQLADLLQSGTQRFDVAWEVKEDAGAKVLKTKKVRTPACKGKFDEEELERGCFVAEKNQALEITFTLKKNFQGTKWRFTGIRVCAGNSESAKDSCSLSSQQRADFLVVANGDFISFPPTGEINLANVAGELRDFEVRVFNFSAGEYVYELTACEEGSLSECAKSDPGGVNRGRN